MSKSNGASNGASKVSEKHSVVLLLRKPLLTAEGTHHDRLEKPHWSWALETVQLQDVIATPQGGMPVLRSALTGRMVIERFRDPDIGRQLAEGVITTPPEGALLDRWLVPAAECHERQLGLRMEPPSKIARVQRSGLVLPGSS